MRQIFICMIISILLGLSIVFLMTRGYGYVNKKPQETKIQEISLTDQLLIEVNERLLNIERAITKLENQIEKSKD